MNLNPLIQGLGSATLGFQQGQQQQVAAQQAHAQAVQQQMLKLALEDAARRQTQSNADRTFGLDTQKFGETNRHNLAEEAKPTTQNLIASRVKELTAGGMALDKANNQARLEMGEMPSPYDPAVMGSEIAKSIAVAQGTKAIPTYADLHPTDTYQIVQGQNPDGTPAFFRVSKQGGPAVPVEGIAPKAASGGAGGSQAPIGDMKDRFAEIQGHAADLAAGKWKITKNMPLREGLTYGTAIENAGGKAPVGKMAATRFMDAVGMAGPGDKDFDRYQALMNSTRAFGDDAAKIFKGRQNEQSVLREVALSELTPDDYRNPQVVKQKLARMQHIITLAEQTSPEQMVAPTAPGKPSGLSAEDAAHAARDPAFAAWLKAHGH